MLRDPSTTLDYSVDWGADYSCGRCADQKQLFGMPTGPGGLSMVANGFDLKSSTVQISGGNAANCCVVGGGAPGDWTGHDNALAYFTEGGWCFIAPVDKMQLVD